MTPSVPLPTTQNQPARSSKPRPPPFSHRIPPQKGGISGFEVPPPTSKGGHPPFLPQIPRFNRGNSLFLPRIPPFEVGTPTSNPGHPVYEAGHPGCRRWGRALKKQLLSGKQLLCKNGRPAQACPSSPLLRPPGKRTDRSSYTGFDLGSPRLAAAFTLL